MSDILQRATVPLRRGLPRVAGGDPWPPAGDAPAEAAPSTGATPVVEVAPAEAALDTADANTPVAAPAHADAEGPTLEVSATVAPTHGVAPSRRRGLPRVPGGEPWPPATAADAAPQAAAAAELIPEATAAAEPTPDATAIAVPIPDAAAVEAPAAEGDTAAEAVAADETHNDAPPVAAHEEAAAGVGDSVRRRGMPRVSGGEPWPPVSGNIPALAPEAATESEPATESAPATTAAPYTTITADPMGTPASPDTTITADTVATPASPDTTIIADPKSTLASPDTETGADTSAGADGSTGVVAAAPESRRRTGLPRPGGVTPAESAPAPVEPVAGPATAPVESTSPPAVDAAPETVPAPAPQSVAAPVAPAADAPAPATEPARAPAAAPAAETEQKSSPEEKSSTAPSPKSAPVADAKPAAKPATAPAPVAKAPAPATAPAAKSAATRKVPVAASEAAVPAVVASGIARINGLSRPVQIVFALLGLLVVAAVAVLATRGLTTYRFVQDFLQTYPGEYPLPENVDTGFPAWINWQHFLNAFFIVLIIRSGWQVRTQKRPSAFWTARWAKTRRKISLTLWFHQFLDVPWLTNGVVFVVLMFVSGHWLRLVPSSWSVFPNALSALVQYLTLQWPTEDGWVNYNSLQQLMYFIVVFIAAPLAAITGVRMSGIWPKDAKRLNAIYPIEVARAIHFPTMLFFVGFIIVHVALVFATGALRNLNHMYASNDDVNWLGFILFFVSLVVMAGGWIAARPLVIAPIARLFGKVSMR